MSTKLCILIVEDSEDDTELLMIELRKGGYEPVFERVDNRQEMSDQLKKQQWDLVIADYSMPQFSGLEALSIFKELELDIPFIIVSGNIDEDTAVNAMQAGAHDYIIKNNLRRLVPAVERELREAEVRRERKRAVENLAGERHLLRTLIDNLPDFVYVKDPQGRFIIANAALSRFLDLESPTELLGKTDHDLFPAADADIRWAEEQNLFKTGQALNFEEPAHYKDGSVGRLLTSKIPVRGPSGNIEVLVGIGRNITEHKLSQEKIQRQLDQMAALQAIDSAITTRRDLPKTLDILLEQVVKQLGIDAAAVLVLNTKQQTLDYAWGRGFHIGNVQHISLPLGRGFAWQAITRRHDVIFNGSPGEFDPQSPENFFVREGFDTYIGTPLLVKDDVKGVLEVFHRKPLTLTDEWWDYFHMLGGQAAVALDNSLLLKDLEEKNIELNLAFDATIEGWARALELRDYETKGHCQRVTDWAIILAVAKGMRGDDLVHFRRGALLHDIGKMGVPDSILLKPARLTDEEWVIMRKHPVFAYEMLSPIEFLRPALDIPYYHHEHWDGSGYLRGLKGEEIPLAARIFAVVDVWDALTTPRNYRDPPTWTPEKTMEYLSQLSGKQFDPAIVEVFLKWIKSGKLKT